MSFPTSEFIDPVMRGIGQSLGASASHTLVFKSPPLFHLSASQTCFHSPANSPSQPPISTGSSPQPTAESGVRRPVGPPSSSLPSGDGALQALRVFAPLHRGARAAPQLRRQVFRPSVLAGEAARRPQTRRGLPFLRTGLVGAHGFAAWKTKDIPIFRPTSVLRRSSKSRVE